MKILEKENAQLTEKVDILNSAINAANILNRGYRNKIEKLKSVLLSIKFLNRDEVDSIIIDLINEWDSTNQRTKESAVRRYNKKYQALNAICNLAIPKIDRDKAGVSK